MIDAGEQVAYLQVGSTGQGDSEEECNNRGNLINAWYALAAAAVGHEDWKSVSNAADNADEEYEAALDAGCFIVYKQGPPPEPEPQIG